MGLVHLIQSTGAETLGCFADKRDIGYSRQGVEVGVPPETFGIAKICVDGVEGEIREETYCCKDRYNLCVHDERL